MHVEGLAAYLMLPARRPELAPDCGEWRSGRAASGTSTNAQRVVLCNQPPLRPAEANRGREGGAGQDKAGGSGFGGQSTPVPGRCLPHPIPNLRVDPGDPAQMRQIRCRDRQSVPWLAGKCRLGSKDRISVECVRRCGGDA
jgi:hypothetical protein